MQLGLPHEPAYSRATACSPGRVREPWGCSSVYHTSPRTRGRQHVAQGESASPGDAARLPHEPAYSRATACSPGRVREPWGCSSVYHTSPRTRGRQRVAQGESASPGDAARSTTRARVLAGDSVRDIGILERFCFRLSLSPASTRACELVAVYPGLADSPWATCCRP